MDKVLNLVSLAKKAGEVYAGEYLTTKAVKEGMAELVIIANDTSEKSKERILSLCKYLEARAVIYGEKETLGHFTGNRDKSVISINDEGFAKAILKLLEGK